jgi:hypothetical protein
MVCAFARRSMQNTAKTSDTSYNGVCIYLPSRVRGRAFLVDQALLVYRLSRQLLCSTHITPDIQREPNLTQISLD